MRYDTRSVQRIALLPLSPEPSTHGRCRDLCQPSLRRLEASHGDVMRIRENADRNAMELHHPEVIDPWNFS